MFTKVHWSISWKSAGLLEIESCNAVDPSLGPPIELSQLYLMETYRMSPSDIFMSPCFLTIDPPTWRSMTNTAVVNRANRNTVRYFGVWLKLTCICVMIVKGLRSKVYIAVNGFRTRSNIQVSPATRHKWTHQALTPAKHRLVLDLPIPAGWKAELF